MDLSTEVLDELGSLPRGPRKRLINGEGSINMIQVQDMPGSVANTVLMLESSNASAEKSDTTLQKQ